MNSKQYRPERAAPALLLTAPRRCLLAAAAMLIASGAASGQAADPIAATGSGQAGESAAAMPSGESGQQLSPAAQVGGWFREAAEAYSEEDHERWVTALENLNRLRPANYDFMRQLVMGYALTGQTSEAFNMMLRMQQQGLAADWDSIDEVESLRQYPLYEYLRDLMKSAGEPGGDVQTAFSVPAEHAMPEALAHDDESGRTFIGTIRDGLILVRGPEGDGFEVFADSEQIEGMTAVFDLLVDEQRGHLWAATGATGQYRHARSQDYGRTALIRFDLDSGEMQAVFRVVPDGTPHLLGAMTMAADGTIYASDTAVPLVYRLEPGAEHPTPFLSHPVLASLRGLALSPDESRLYVADYELGVFFFELGEEPRGFVLGIPETLNLAGIDGLYYWQDHLVAIQNGVTPQRVIRMKLDDTGTRVASVATLAKALPEFATPTYGDVVGDDLLFMAASHWSQVDARGRPIDPPLSAIPVVRASIAEAKNMVVGQEMLEQIKRQGQMTPMNDGG